MLLKIGVTELNVRFCLIIKRFRPICLYYPKLTSTLTLCQQFQCLKFSFYQRDRWKMSYLPFSFGLDAQVFFLHFFLILFFSLIVKCLLLIPTFPVSVSPCSPDLYCCHHQCQLWSLKHLSFICSFVPTFQFLLTLIAPLCSKNSEQTNKRLVFQGELPLPHFYAVSLKDEVVI